MKSPAPQRQERPRGCVLDTVADLSRCGPSWTLTFFFLMINSICASALHSCLEHQFKILSSENGMQGRGLRLNKRRQGDRRKGQAVLVGAGKQREQAA